MSIEPEEDENKYFVTRDGYEYNITWTVRGLPLVSFGPVDFISLLLYEVYLFIEGVLSEFLPMKIGILRQKQVSWQVFPRLIFKEKVPKGADIDARRDELLAMVLAGEFDPKE